jgi:predicted nucleic acid-binding protein
MTYVSLHRLRLKLLKDSNTKGTLGILWDAYKVEEIDRETAELLSFDLIQKGYRIKEEIFVEFLRRLKRGAGKQEILT